MKRSLASAIRSGAQGVKITCGGRLGGGEMSRSETYSEGRVPLHTIRADIDYGFDRGEDDLRPHRRQGLDQQGRDHARGLRERSAAGDARLGDQDQARRARRRRPRGSAPRARAAAGAARTARASARCASGRPGERGRAAVAGPACAWRPRRRAAASAQRERPRTDDAADGRGSRSAGGRAAGRDDAGPGRPRRRDSRPPSSCRRIRAERRPGR